VDRQDKYKAKNLIDTIIYRAGDQVGAWSYAGLAALGIAASGVSVVAIPIVIGWVFLSIGLGKGQKDRVEKKLDQKSVS
jgi:AAA family ATP:ADP antiporter